MSGAAPSPTGYPDSWYAATAAHLPELAPLEGSERADVCVIGGGYTGLSTALHLAERGYSVVLLEAHRVGWGASGRNGGQIGTGQRVDEAQIERIFGPMHARELLLLSLEARQLVRDLIRVHRIACDLTTGQVVGASKPADVGYLRQRADKLAGEYNYPHIRFVPLAEMRSLVATERFLGGYLDSDAAHLHPLNFALGLAEACVRAGVRLYERSAVVRLVSGGEPRVHTDRGAVQARFVVLACNGYLGRLEPRIAGRIMPINNFLVATVPLGARATELIPSGACVHDTQFVVNYFRLSADGRLIFGGGETYRRRFPADIRAFVRPHLLRIFPQLHDAPLEYGWGGTLAITMNRLPHFGRLDGNVYFAHGYSGHGIANATFAGKLIAEAISGTAEKFDVFARIPPPVFPGGTWLRWPGQVLGMLYYALRDRL